MIHIKVLMTYVMILSQALGLQTPVVYPLLYGYTFGSCSQLKLCKAQVVPFGSLL